MSYWVIESRGSHSVRDCYARFEYKRLSFERFKKSHLAGEVDCRFVTDIEEATRFAREDDAIRVQGAVMHGIVAEHEDVAQVA